MVFYHLLIPKVTMCVLLRAVISPLKPYISKTDQTSAVAVHTVGQTVYTVSVDSCSSAEAISSCLVFHCSEFWHISKVKWCSILLFPFLDLLTSRQACWWLELKGDTMAGEHFKMSWRSVQHMFVGCFIQTCKCSRIRCECAHWVQVLVRGRGDGEQRQSGFLPVSRPMEPCRSGVT